MREDWENFDEEDMSEEEVQAVIDAELDQDWHEMKAAHGQY